MNVKDAMSSRLEWVHPTLPLREAARRMRALNIGCLPVGESGRLMGVITDRDIVCRCVADGRPFEGAHVYSAMTNGAAWCFEDQDGEAAAEIMRERRVRRLPVLDRSQRLVGLLPLDDLCGRIPEAVFVATMNAITSAYRATAEAQNAATGKAGAQDPG